MTPVIHEISNIYEAEYRAVRAALIVRGSSLSEWARSNRVSRQLVASALRGKSFGKKARQVRLNLLKEVG